MYTNADVTLYLYSKNGKTEKYIRLPVEGVYWEDVKRANTLMTGQSNADSVLIVIPLESLSCPISFTPGKDLAVKGPVSYTHLDVYKRQLQYTSYALCIG